VRLAREAAGRFLQVVPTLTDVTQTSVGGSFHGQNLQLAGTGLIEGDLAVLFGPATLADTGGVSGLDVFGTNSLLNTTVPSGVPTGPIRVRTFGGTSEAFGLTFTSITATAASGTPADAGQASANPGQTVLLNGTGLDLSTDVVFLVSDPSGNVSQRTVRPVAVDDTGTQITVLVPTEAVTGPVSVVGDTLASQVLLQVVPVVSGVDLTSVDVNNAFLTISGLGLIEGNGTRYQLGSVSIVDPGVSTGPDAFSSNTRANVSTAFSDGLFGSVAVTTAGGTSAPFSVGYTDLEAAAFSGTPADGGQASANPGQVVTVLGSGLSLATDLVGRYFNDAGNLVVQNLNPGFVSADGTEAQVTVPGHWTGAFALNVVGSDLAPLLQVVPTLTGIDVSGVGFATLFGSGLVEGGGTVYRFAGVDRPDPDAGSTTVDVFSSGTRANVVLPVHGLGELTVTTAAGTSAPLALNDLHPGQGQLIDVAYQASTGQVIAADNNEINRIDPATGSTVGTLDIPATTSTGNLGLQVLPGPIASLGGSAVAAGSLLVTNGSASFDQVFAINLGTGATVATLNLGQNLDPVAGVYHPGRGTLFLLDDSPNQLLEVSPATGAVLNTLAAPFDINFGGLAVDPVSGDLWVGSSQVTRVAQVDPASGAVLREVELSTQGLGFEASGLAFHSDGDLLVSSTQGVVFKVDIPAPLSLLLNLSSTSRDATLSVEEEAPQVVQQERPFSPKGRRARLRLMDAEAVEAEQSARGISPHGRRLAGRLRPAGV
jgi:hypothetical protein